MRRRIDWRWVAVVVFVCLVFAAMCAISLYALFVSWPQML